MKNGYCCDYLTFTIKCDNLEIKGFDLINWFLSGFMNYLNDDFIKIEDFVFQNYGFNCFNRSAQYHGQNNFMICASESGRLEEFVFVSVSGQGIKAIGSDRLNALIKFAAILNANFTRLDLCYDCFDESFPKDRFIETFERYQNGENLLETRCKRDTSVIHRQVYNERVYKNVTFGSRRSSQYFRMYDKIAEQASKGIYYEDLSSWLRLEFECRREVGNAVADFLVENNFDYATAFKLYINKMFRILAYSADSVGDFKNKDRVPTADWWHDFVNLDIKGNVTYIKPDFKKTVDRMYNHLEYAYSDFLGSVFVADPERFIDFISGSVENCLHNAKYSYLIENPDLSDKLKDLLHKMGDSLK